MNNRVRYIGVTRGSHNECNPELWLAVIERALRDLASANRAQAKWKRECTEWFFTANEDFDMVCDLAGLHAGSVRKFAYAIQKNPKLLQKVFL
jgi:hypothetical protein